MDMSAILPLLLKKQGDEKMQTLLKMAQGGKPDVSTLMKLAENKRPSAQGLKPIAGVAPFSVLGKIAAYYAS